MVRSLAAMREVVRVVCYLLASKSLLSPGLKAILDNLIPSLRPFREFQLDPALFILHAPPALASQGGGAPQQGSDDNTTRKTATAERRRRNGAAAARRRRNGGGLISPFINSIGAV